MVGGYARSRPPRELADNPEAWPHADVADTAAAVVQHIARAIDFSIKQRELSLRQVAAASGVNRQAIADLIAGRAWPDVATVARPESGLDTPLWPQSGGTERFR